MNRSSDTKKVTAFEGRLGGPLPREYLRFLQDGRSEFDSGGIPGGAGWLQSAEAFLDEWRPLGGHLFPVEHLGDGIFACLHVLAGREEGPVLGWDVSADLAEQACPLLAEDWEGYRRRRESEGEPPLGEVELALARRRPTAVRELESGLGRFQEAVERFERSSRLRHDDRTFEHHEDVPPPRERDWKPERFAVHDHLLGVMAYRWNGPLDCIDVVGFATRDHTNYARGSGTAALLAGLLCEWAAKGARSIRFLERMPSDPRDPAPNAESKVPHEVGVLGWLVGAGVRPGQPTLERDHAIALFLALTPFPPFVRRRIAEEGLDVAGACLAIHRQIWSPLEVALLIDSCPQARSIFRGEVDVGEMVRFHELLEHARAAVLVGFGERLMTIQAGLQGAATPTFDPLLGDRCLAYAALARSDTATEWRRAGSSEGTPHVTPAGAPVVLVGVAEPESREQEWGERLVARAREWVGDAEVLGLIPDRVPAPADRFPFPLVRADLDPLSLDLEIERRSRNGRRIRR